MSDIEFAKEVAEKVWGEMKPLYALPSWDEEIKDEVNSWAGFGRTVEAMEKRGWYFQPWTKDQGKTINLGFLRVVGSLRWRPASLKLNIKATHQAALDAVKD